MTILKISNTLRRNCQESSLRIKAPELSCRALRRVATIESIGSSTRIEGARLSDRPVEKLIAGLEAKRFASRDEHEVAGYADTMKIIFDNWQEIELTENHIRQLHRDLLTNNRMT